MGRIENSWNYRMENEKGCWVVGYGNPQRRDDGIGHRVVSLLEGKIKEKKMKGIHLMALQQLGPEVVEQLKEAQLVLFVDASIEKLDGGYRWVEVESELGDLQCLMHHMKPSFILGLLKSIYRKMPRSWLISIQGEDFDFGEGLSVLAEERAEKVASGIYSFLENEISMENVSRN